MKILKLKDMFRGWFLGDFEPSAFKTKDVEVGVLTHKKGEYWQAHYHKVATEINILLKGDMSVNDIHINEGDIFVIEPNEVSAPIFHEDCVVLCVKVPSVPGDKYMIGDN